MAHWLFYRSNILKEVPYSRLLETNLSTKRDSDSKLQSEVSKLTTNGTSPELLPKNSVSDSKLAVDYFNSSVEVRKSPMSHSVSGKFELEKKSILIETKKYVLNVCFANNWYSLSIVYLYSLNFPSSILVVS